MTTSLISFNLTQTEALPDPTLRSFQTISDHKTEAAFTEATSDGRRITPATVNKVAGAIMRQSNTPQGVVEIQGGFRSPRFVVTLTVQSTSALGVTTIDTFSGFTDIMDFAMQSQDISPATRIFFNSYASRRQTQTRQQGQNMMVTNGVSGGQLALPTTLKSASGISNVDALQRPVDVLNEVATISMQSTLGNMSDIRHVDSQYIPGQSVSQRKLASPTAYLTDLLSGWQKSRMQCHANHTEELSQVAFNAVDSSNAESISTNMFIQRLFRETSMGQQASVTFGELVALFPDIRRRMNLRLAKVNVDHTNTHQSSNDNSVASTLSDVIATNVASALETWNVNNIVFIVNNWGNPQENGGVVTRLSGGNANTGVQSTAELLNGCATTISQTLDPLIKAYGVQNYQYVVRAISRGNADIEIQHDGMTIARKYIKPLWCDSFTMPTNTQSAVLGMTANNLFTVMDKIKYKN